MEAKQLFMAEWGGVGDKIGLLRLIFGFATRNFASLEFCLKLGLYAFLSALI